MSVAGKMGFSTKQTHLEMVVLMNIFHVYSSEEISKNFSYSQTFESGNELGYD